MRIFLLDRSGSMGDPFSGRREFAGRTRKTEAVVKLEAAKTELLRGIASLSSVTSIAIFEFTSTASLIYEGNSNDRRGIENAINDLMAYNGTKIEVALDAVSDYVTKLANLPIIQVLVISDGLSDLGTARISAQKLAKQRAIIINVVLIDPTDEGESVARAIAINGEVYAVTSSGEFSDTINNITLQQAQLARQVDEMLGFYQIEEESVVGQTSPEERLSFTAAYPGAISPDSWYSLLVYLHLPTLQDQVIDIINEKGKQMGMRLLSSMAEANTMMRRGTWLRLIPRLEGITFNPISQEVAWLEDLQELNFRLITDKVMMGRSVFGSIDVYCGPALIGQIPLSINIRDLAGKTTPVLTSQAQVFSRIFASYAHADTAIVEACTTAYKALGIYVYIDKHSLRSGQVWQPMLHHFIDKSDLFQLYWSSTSSQTSGVEDEWRHALSLIGRKSEMFIRPLYWEEQMPKPPDELSHIHFAKLDLASLGLDGNKSNSPASRSNRKSVENYPLVPTVTIPVLPGIMPETQRAIQNDLSYAIHFLEGTTGLRYYPVPTLLVDRHVIKSVKSFYLSDLSRPSDQTEQALAFSDILRSIELTFHVRRWHPERKYYDEWDSLFGMGQIVTKDQFEYLRLACEGRIQSVIKPLIQLNWIQARNELVGSFPQFNSEQRFSEFILSALDHVINTAKPRYSNQPYHIQIRFWQDRDVLERVENLLRSAGIKTQTTNHDKIEIHEFFPKLISALHFLRKELQSILPKYDTVTIISLADSPTPYLESVAIIKIVDKLCEELRGENTYQFDLAGWLSEILIPPWRRMRNELVELRLADVHPDANVFEFISVIFNTIHGMLRQGLHLLGDFIIQNQYSMDEGSWHNLQRAIPSINLMPIRVEKNFSNDEVVYLEGKFSEFVWVYRELKDRLIRILSQYQQFKTSVEQVFSLHVPTYGIYTPANSLTTDNELKRWAFERDIPTELTLPQNPRVLFCLTALEQFKSELKKLSLEPGKIKQMAQDFQRSVLIHEHWHAILETGLDNKHIPATGVQFDEAWRSATPLNESLAVWMELHNARQNSELMDSIWAYIRSGTYPQWPYRGAEKVEALFQKEGLQAIRDLIESLRKDPEVAQVTFDAILS